MITVINILLIIKSANSQWFNPLNVFNPQQQQGPSSFQFPNLNIFGNNPFLNQNQQQQQPLNSNHQQPQQFNQQQPFISNNQQPQQFNNQLQQPYQGNVFLQNPQNQNQRPPLQNAQLNNNNNNNNQRPKPSKKPQIQTIRPTISSNLVSSGGRISERKCSEYANRLKQSQSVGSLSFDASIQDIVVDKCDASTGLVVGGENAKAGM